MRYIGPLLVALFIGVFLGQLIGCTKAAVLKPSTLVPVQAEYGGENPQYIHGAHCTDGRVF